MFLSPVSYWYWNDNHILPHSNLMLSQRMNSFIDFKPAFIKLLPITQNRPPSHSAFASKRTLHKGFLSIWSRRIYLWHDSYVKGRAIISIHNGAVVNVISPKPPFWLGHCALLFCNSICSIIATCQSESSPSWICCLRRTYLCCEK